jgi:hypothetical protein
MKIFNGTPHPINIVNAALYDKNIRKYIAPSNAEVVMSIPSDGVLSAQVDTVPGSPVNGIPVYEKSISGCDPLPEGYDIYIVSQLYVSAARACGMDTSKLYTVADPVYTPDGRTILGSRGICPAF